MRSVLVEGTIHKVSLEVKILVIGYLETEHGGVSAGGEQGRG